MARDQVNGPGVQLSNTIQHRLRGRRSGARLGLYDRSAPRRASAEPGNQNSDRTLNRQITKRSTCIENATNLTWNHMHILTS